MLRAFKRFLRKLKKKAHPLYRSGQAIYQAHVDYSTPQVSTTAWIVYNSNTTNNTLDQSSGSMIHEDGDGRIVKKPVEVYKEIISDIPVMNLYDLDKQISVIQRRMDVLDEQGIKCSDELVALRFLKARKKYNKYKSKFTWAITTDAKIKELLAKYKLTTSNLQPNYKNIPMEAIDEIEKFADAFECVDEGKPEFQLIMDVGGKEQKKDPILLAGSPFGKYYYILGAWDKEVEYVDDLVYNGK